MPLCAPLKHSSTLIWCFHKGQQQEEEEQEEKQVEDCTEGTGQQKKSKVWREASWRGGGVVQGLVKKIQEKKKRRRRGSWRECW